MWLSLVGRNAWLSRSRRRGVFSAVAWLVHIVVAVVVIVVQIAVVAASCPPVVVVVVAVVLSHYGSVS